MLAVLERERRSPLLFSCLLCVGLAISTGVVSRAQACAKGSVAPFMIDQSSSASDDQPPTPFRELKSFARRVASTHCNDKTCTSSSCEDAGVLQLTFEPPQDEASDGLGYRVVWLRGHMPPSLQRSLEVLQPLSTVPTLTFELGWDEISELDGELALIAVDRSGNESTMSAPVHVEWGGCTSYFDDPSCLRDASGCGVAPQAGRRELQPVAALMFACAVWGLTKRRAFRRRVVVVPNLTSGLDQ
jgi:hypothetical protein